MYRPKIELYLAEHLFHRMLRWKARQLPAPIEAGLETIARQGGRNDAYQRCRAIELFALLDEARPRMITELGSGFSTVVFANYSSNLISYEANEHWAQVTRSALTIDCVKVTEVVTIGRNAGYALPIPVDSDFVYVDGPSARKAPNANIIEFLQSGHRPKMIVVDGRIETVDAIRELTSDYTVSFSTQYSIKKRRLRYFFPFTVHSIFRLKDIAPKVDE